jgi:hypothetical protein
MVFLWFLATSEVRKSSGYRLNETVQLVHGKCPNLEAPEFKKWKYWAFSGFSCKTFRETELNQAIYDKEPWPWLNRLEAAI